jgi:DNA (cytosine-5)-methyltransferase 1
VLTHVDLFSGIGGFALAAEWAGFRTVVFCEIDEFCQAVLKERFGVSIQGKGKSKRAYDNLDKDSQAETLFPDSFEAVADTGCQRQKGAKLETEGIEKSIAIPLIPDIRDFDGSRFRGATLLTGGFPCQPFSHAGKRRGKEDDRHLWPEMLRVIKEARPAWIVGENVSGIISMELDQVLADLEVEGYATRTFPIGAVAVNAPHRRMRVWIVANDSKDSLLRGNRGRGNGDTPRLRRALQVEGPNSDAPDTATKGLSGVCQGELREQLFQAQRRSWEEPWPEVATRLCRVDDGVPRRVDRLKALGNSIVPQVAYQIIKGIAEIENEQT